MAAELEPGRFARRWNDEIWGKRNLDAIDDLIAEDFVEHDPMRPEPVRGPDGVRESVETMLGAFPDSEVEIEQVVAEGDWVAQRLTATGTHEGEFVGVEPTGESVRVTIMAFVRIVDGRAVEEWQLVDTLGMLAQIGAVEPPGPYASDPRPGKPRRTSSSTPDGSKAARSATIAENKRLARRFPEEVATGGEIDRIDEICAADAVEHTPLGVLYGREELKEQSEYVHAAFPDVSVTVEDEVAEGDSVAHRLTFRGTHEGEFAGVEPTGEAVEIANMLFTRVEDGLIAERWLLADMLGLLQQIGVVEPPGE